MPSDANRLPAATEASIERVLRDIVRPGGYVQWEYLSRQRLLSTRVARRASGGIRVLDIGCGYGTLSLTLREAAGLDVAAMDILRERVMSVVSKRASRPPPARGRLDLLMGNAERGLPFRPATFDAVVATEVLEHLDEPARMLAEVHRVLRPGGRFYMTTPNAEALPYRLLRFLPKPIVKRLAASLTTAHLHPELLDRHASHPDEHRREGFTLGEVRDLGARCSLTMLAGYTYRIPIPDKIMARTPRGLSGALAAWGAHPLPLGLQLFGEFARTEDARGGRPSSP